MILAWGAPPPCGVVAMPNAAMGPHTATRRAPAKALEDRVGCMTHVYASNLRYQLAVACGFAVRQSPERAFYLTGRRISR